jgi:lysozyme family protein
VAEFEFWIDGLLKAEGGFAADDNGAGACNYGITERFLKQHNIDLTGDGLVDVKDVKALTPEEAKSIYRKYFWDPMWLDEIKDQRLANLLGHMGVNQGIGTAVGFLQNALQALGAVIKTDCIMGPVTLVSANDARISPYCTLMVKYFALKRYVMLAITDKQKYGDDLPGWFKRLESL